MLLQSLVTARRFACLGLRALARAIRSERLSACVPYVALASPSEHGGPVGADDFALLDFREGIRESVLGDQPRDGMPFFKTGKVVEIECGRMRSVAAVRAASLELDPIDACPNPRLGWTRVPLIRLACSYARARSREQVRHIDSRPPPAALLRGLKCSSVPGNAFPQAVQTLESSW
jgi:hypothetical protein